MSKIIQTVCEEKNCIGCGACIDLCPKSAIRIIDRVSIMEAEINESLCIECDLCKRVCPMNTTAYLRSPILWKQGWCSDEEQRLTSSSGGAVSSIIRAFIKNQGVAIACSFNKGNFGFEIVTHPADLKNIKGSKYVKSDASGVYRAIKELISQKKVLFIGLPCQVSALLNSLQYSKNIDNLYTIDLICHGTPSINLLNSFLKEYGANLNELSTISFRNNNSYNLSCNGKKIAGERIRDYYTSAFLKGTIHTEGCYKCRYAGRDRCSDITAGDSWGSELSQEEIDKGISLLLVQTQKGKALIEEADLSLYDVDIEKAIKANRQLIGPAEKDKKRQLFFNLYQKSSSFNYAYRMCYPMHFFRQEIKKTLYRLKLLR